MKKVANQGDSGNGTAGSGFSQKFARAAGGLDETRTESDSERAGRNRAIVSITNGQGNIRQTRTNAFGYYRFDDVQAGQTYTFQVASKRYQFAPQVVSIEENVQDLDFVATD